MKTLFIVGFIAAPIYVALRVAQAWLHVDDDDGEWPFADEDDEGVIVTMRG
jgi:hypothetical protein